MDTKNFWLEKAALILTALLFTGILISFSISCTTGPKMPSLETTLAVK